MSSERGRSGITASVVLYNTSRSQLDRLLGCISNSSLVPHLYVIDNSLTPIDHPAFNAPAVTYIKTAKNLGYGGGHNVALRLALKSSVFHFVVNPDIHFGPQELAKMVEFMRQELSIGQIMPRIVYEDGSIQYLCKLLPTPADLFLRRFAGSQLRTLLKHRMERFELRFTGYNRVMDVPYLSGCFMVFRVTSLRKIGLFDEQFFMYPEDIDITRRMNAEFRTVFFPGATVVHEHARDSYKDRRSMWIHMRNLIRYFNKWGWIRDPERSKVNRATLRQFGL